jgi:hypothetical protein
VRCLIHSGLLEQGGCSGALAGAGDSDVDELGDGDDRHSGIENDAEIKILKVARNGKYALKSMNLLGGHVNFWGFEADFVLGHFEKFTFGYTFFDILKNQRQSRSFCS